MNNQYQVEWTRTANNDLIRIIEFIATDSPTNARRVLKKIKSEVASLHQTPKRGRVIPELKEQGITQYNEIVIAPWRLMYRVSEKTVYVVSVIDSRRNVEDILLERFTM
ncbi:type II toxin-antitoxin system RelE/ParE family toxin [Chrysiogenes arsenatis]|uniref:type II toxin-antitoxin system RelE/ParE family toxin n=1 Tax=Chrysiogenes arsenatis TaxID=309797 RepID=UPI0004888C91|nr:type II toxin-antitoxin system RelE/ParE family toxin [Chrysiogenes arsenatis]